MSEQHTKDFNSLIQQCGKHVADLNSIDPNSSAEAENDMAVLMGKIIELQKEIEAIESNAAEIEEKQQKSAEQARQAIKRCIEGLKKHDGNLDLDYYPDEIAFIDENKSAS